MPYIESAVNEKLDAAKEKTIKEKLGKAINLISGKTEDWLMINFKDEQRMYFHGDKDMPMCYSEVKIFGDAPAEELEALTAEICSIYKDELGIEPENTYVKYELVHNWGWNNKNF